jgi:LmbE family N-acetylglucosaminyl deacetylase
MQGGILAVLAHPDDESFVVGGALSYYQKQGRHTALVCLTDGQSGRAGVEGRPALVSKENLGKYRRRELQQACERLGIGELITPGWMDGQLEKVSDDKGAMFIAGHIRRLRPAILISFGPEGAANTHPDHKATWRWSDRAWDLAADASVITGHPPHAVSKYYWVTWPDVIAHLRKNEKGSPITTQMILDEDIIRAKFEAFECHASQQDHKQLYTDYQRALEGHEYYHLARSRAGFPEGLERDLYERV